MILKAYYLLYYIHHEDQKKIYYIFMFISIFFSYSSSVTRCIEIKIIGHPTKNRKTI